MADFQRPLLSAQDEGHSEYVRKEIPSFGDLKNMYNQKWAKEKQDFQAQLKANFTHACFLLSITRRPILVVSDLSICSRCPCNTSTEIDALVTAITSAVLAPAFFASSRSAFVKSESLFSITSP